MAMAARCANLNLTSNAPGPDYKLISVSEDGHDYAGNAKLNALLADVEPTGASVTITKHGRPVAGLIPAHQGRRRFVQLTGACRCRHLRPMPALVR